MTWYLYHQEMCDAMRMQCVLVVVGPTGQYTGYCMGLYRAMCGAAGVMWVLEYVCGAWHGMACVSWECCMHEVCAAMCMGCLMAVVGHAGQHVGLWAYTVPCGSCDCVSFAGVMCVFACVHGTWHCMA